MTGLARVDATWARLLGRMREHRPWFNATLVRDDRAGRCAVDAGGRCRQFAWAETLTPPEISVAGRLEDQPAGNIEGVLAHELGHAMLFTLGRPRHEEREADAVAEHWLGVRIGYDADGVQTTAGGERPRPGWIDARRNPDGIEFRDSASPLTYRRSADVQRLAICDLEVRDPPGRGDTYFAEIGRWRKRARSGRLLKRPVLEEIIPGVDDNCIVGFLDYTRRGPGYWYLDYMATRQDQRGKGYARRLVEEFFARRAEPGATIHWGKMMQPHVGHLRAAMMEQHPEVSQPGAVMF